MGSFLDCDSRVYKTNVVGTLNMLGLAKRVGARFLLTSTSEVYGDPLQHPQVETYWGNVNPIGASFIPLSLSLSLSTPMLRSFFSTVAAAIVAGDCCAG